METKVLIEKIVHGGQGMATLPDGRKAFLWNALPGEEVTVRLTRNKKDYAEGIAEDILLPSPDRIDPMESNYLATSPWQIMTLAAEDTYKQAITQEVFGRAGVELPEFSLVATSKGSGGSAAPGYYYRNKMEYSFWGDENGLSLALHHRGSRGKQIVTGSKLAMPSVDAGAAALLAKLQRVGVRASKLKSMVVRSSQDDRVVASLFVKAKDFPSINIPGQLKGLRVYYSDPKSPASVPSLLLSEQGDCELSDTLLGKEFKYDVDSFFQVNVPVFELALSRIRQYIKSGPVVDMYGGVGSIGLSVGSGPVIVELDSATVAMAHKNISDGAEVVQASTERALEYIEPDKILIVDPPRAGMHKDVVARIVDARPSQIIYLSCNPATQARDLALLKDYYIIDHFEVYNFFPRTPHIESLAVLSPRSDG